MGKRWAVVVLAMSGLVGCASLERYHKPVELGAIPTKVVVSLSRSYPNVTVWGYELQNMYDGRTRYAASGVDANKKEVVLVFNADGTEVK